MKSLLPFIFLLFYFNFIGQVNSQLIEKTISSKIFKSDRTISIYLPQAYLTKDNTDKYIVAYLLDGQFQPYVTMVGSIMSYYEETNQGIPLIVVGIHTDERWAEFVPTAIDQQTTEIEGADKLTQFINMEVMPYINSNYRTKNFTVGIGHSLGGTYVINEIMKEHSIFNAVIAVSPNLTMYNEQILKSSQEYYAKNLAQNRFIYSAVGTIGEMEQSFNSSLIKLDSITKNVNPTNLFWQCEVLNNENHMTTFVPTFNKGYLLLSSKLMLLDDDLLELANHSLESIENALINIHEQQTLFSGEDRRLTIENILDYSGKFAQSKKFKAAFNLNEIANKMLLTTDLNSKETKESLKKVEDRREWWGFNILAQEAKELSETGNFKNASEVYKKAFEQNVIRGTHLIRIESVAVFAQAGELDLAFEQLELLANKFKLGGNGRFINDSLCEPLRNDPRWEKYMGQLADNAKNINR